MTQTAEVNLETGEIVPRPTGGAIVVPETMERRSSRALAPVDSDTDPFLAMVARAASDPSIDVDKMAKLIDIRDRELAKRAEGAFIEAMSQFKQNPPRIVKDKHVKFTTTRGVTEYDHATLAGICDAVAAGLGAVGISHRWVTEQGDAGRIKVTCVLTHTAGHSESTALMASPDDSGGKNSIQAIGSTVSYLQRYTLMAATGLAAGMPDDDGRTAGAKQEPVISESQAADLEALRSEKGANRKKVLEYIQKLQPDTEVRDFEDLQEKHLQTLVTMLRQFQPRAHDGAQSRLV